MGPVEKLLQLGQSVWLDTIDRDLLTSGGLKRLVEQEGVRGVTTNPTIFEQALKHGGAYDASVASLAATEARRGGPVRDAGGGGRRGRRGRAAAGVRRRRGGADGFVSIEVSPTQAFDTAGHHRRGAPALVPRGPAERDGEGARHRARGCRRSSS